LARAEPGPLQCNAEGLAQAAAPGGCERQGAAFAHALQPVEVEAALRQRGADAAAEMRPPLGPVEARPAEDAPAGARGTEVDAEFLEECDAAVGDSPPSPLNATYPCAQSASVSPTPSLPAKWS
jgi:hypothetical protein